MRPIRLGQSDIVDMEIWAKKNYNSCTDFQSFNLDSLDWTTKPKPSCKSCIHYRKLFSQLISFHSKQLKLSEKCSRQSNQYLISESWNTTFCLKNSPEEESLILIAFGNPKVFGRKFKLFVSLFQPLARLVYHRFSDVIFKIKICTNIFDFFSLCHSHYIRTKKVTSCPIL